MPRPAAPSLARGHLRVVTAPAAERPRGERRASLVARGLVASALLRWVAARACLATAVAMLPLLWRGAPLGRRLRPPAPRDARIIPFQARRQALPR